MIETFLILASALIICLFLRNRSGHAGARLQELEKLVENRTKKLAAENAARDLVWANIGHEISNPMNGLIGLAESIKTESLDADSKHKLELLGHCANHVSSLLDDILKFSGVHTSTLTIEAKPFSISGLITLLKAVTLTDSEKYRIPVEIVVSPEVHKRLIGDARRICQILQNFVGNSIKYSGSNQVFVRVTGEKSGDDTSKILFEVSDDGAGISIEEQIKLFTPFQRGSDARRSDIPGTGLGLAICKTLAEKMGGQVWMQSEPGKGSCFYFSATFSHPIDFVEVPTIPSSAIAPNLKKALVVDDKEYNRIALSGLLEKLGLSVQCASNDHEALTLATANEFDLILLDYSLPGLHGPAIARAIRASACPSSRALILATTAFNTKEVQHQCMAAGMNAFITKPITLAIVRRTLSSLNGSLHDITDLPSPPVDQVANLRILATKKNITLAAELNLFFSELELELKQLSTSLREESFTRLSYHIHLLYGRCSFIRERNLEQTLRKIEKSALEKNWADAQLLWPTLQAQAGNLRVRLFSEIPIAQHA